MRDGDRLTVGAAAAADMRRSTAGRGGSAASSRHRRLPAPGDPLRPPKSPRPCEIAREPLVYVVSRNASQSLPLGRQRVGARLDAADALLLQVAVPAVTAPEIDEVGMAGR